jgi:hypothetical protein
MNSMISKLGAAFSLLDTKEHKQVDMHHWPTIEENKNQLVKSKK